MFHIRRAHPDDAPSVQSIYAPIVRDTPISFEVDIPSVEDMQGRIIKTMETYPWIVCEYDAQTIGYAYASRHQERAAYQWAVNVSVYIHEDWRRKKIGQALYTTLFSLLRAQGFYHAFAGITISNPGSIGLHEHMGMLLIGIYKQIGYKVDKWYDVGWWQLILQDLPESLPHDPIPQAKLDPAIWQTAVEQGEIILRG
jgi:L-amino acid N-acyltransferase YncA